jgi:hypothetical protein
VRGGLGGFGFAAAEFKNLVSLRGWTIGIGFGCRFDQILQKALSATAFRRSMSNRCPQRLGNPKTAKLL